MVRAAALGRIDYTQADSDDKLWLLRERLILEDLDRELETQRLEQLHMHYATAALGWGPWDPKAQVYQSMMDQAGKLMEEIENTLMPWDAMSSQARWQANADRMRQTYIERFGEAPDSPEAKAKVKADNAGIERKKLFNQRETEIQKQHAIELRARQHELRARRLTRRGRKL